LSQEYKNLYKMSDEEYFTNYDSDKNSDAENESQDNQNSIPQSSKKK